MPADDVLTISKLAGTAGVAASTVRFYERQGLLKPRGRSSSGYRQCVRDDVDRLRFIRSAQRMGLTLRDIQVLLDYGDGDDVECGQVRDLLEQRLAKVQQQRRELDLARRALQAAIQLCAGSPRHDRCKVIDALRGEGIEE